PPMPSREAGTPPPLPEEVDTSAPTPVPPAVTESSAARPPAIPSAAAPSASEPLPPTPVPAAAVTPAASGAPPIPVEVAARLARSVKQVSDPDRTPIPQAEPEARRAPRPSQPQPQVGSNRPSAGLDDL